MPAPSPRRIVSLVPSATETVFRLGAGAELVGRSHVCLYPDEARDRPALTTPRLTESTSRGIHDELRSLLSEGLAIYDIDLDALRALAPTHLLVQDQCSVCAVSPADLASALRDWFGDPPELITLAPHQLIDVWNDIRRIGEAVGRGPEAEHLCRELAERLSELVESRAHFEADGHPATRPLRVACVEWLDPLMIAGHWVPELVRIAGGEPVLAKTGAASTVTDVEELAKARPEVLVVQICGFDLAATQRAWFDAGELRAALAEAVGAKTPVFLTDGDAYFNRPGPRLVDSAEILGALLSNVESAAPEAAQTDQFRRTSFEPAA